MTKKKTKIELVRFTDGIYVIVGAHLSLEEAREQFGEEYADEDYDYDNDCIKRINSVKHQWVRYEYIGPDNCPDDYDDPEPGDALWMLKRQEKRPKGCVRKATVINS
jgi:hypothetical protein